MIWVIEFRNGSYLQSLAYDNSGPLVSALRFNTEAEADELMRHHPWIVLNAGMAKIVRASRYTDMGAAARAILDKMPPSALPLEQIAWLHQQLERLAQAIWTQGWDCREEQGPLAGAFGHANRYNPYRRQPEPRKCRHCGAQPLLTERGRCEDCGDCQGCGSDECPRCEALPQPQGSAAMPGTVDAVFQVFPDKTLDAGDLLISVGKMRDDPAPNLEPRVTFETPTRRRGDGEV